ncbi:DUF7109 family protein [Haloarcula onubensis]|uniref:Uncharacterized protein n=1 Tax=Haloarcula onubensis TaxID=2950539 RepID=A0ABU2FK53_9EURY|nr:hypothetical protein [Halomicroarcula sp. S3CR25-11]MDS0281139.1 hypothetical protein [Halomicroarcula sp. S3CR25-11]
MELTPDELAGVVDVVGPVTRATLVQACGELAFKRGDDVDSETVEAAIEGALSTYHLVDVADHDAEAAAPLIVVGPAAFPDIVEGVADLPHILDLPERDPSEETVAAAAERRFREDAAEAVRAGDDERIAELLDVSYDLEAWGPVELASARGLLDEATQTN